MRYILVIFFTIGLTLNSFSQLKLSTIMNLIKMDFNKFEDFTIKNGWSFHSIKNTKELNGLCYVRKSSNDKEFLTLYTKYFNEDKHLTYQLHNQNSYLNLKNQIKLNGFKFLNSEMRSNSIKYNYRKVMNDYLSYEISIYP